MEKTRNSRLDKLMNKENDSVLFMILPTKIDSTFFGLDSRIRAILISLILKGKFVVTNADHRIASNDSIRIKIDWNWVRLTYPNLNEKCWDVLRELYKFPTTYISKKSIDAASQKMIDDLLE